MTTPTKHHIETLAQMIGARLDEPSIYLGPEPQIFMHSPYELLDYICEQKLLTETEIDHNLVLGQNPEESTLQ